MRRTLIAAIILGASVGSAALAQDNVVQLRVDKLEKEMRAVQRKVFGASGATVDPEIGGTSAENGNTGPAPIADLTARIDALEGQLKTLTGQVEQDQNKIRKLEELVKAMDARVKTLEGSGVAPAPVAASTQTPAAVKTVSTPTSATPAPATVKPAVLTTSTPATPKPAATKLAIATPKAETTKTPAKVDTSRKAMVAKVEFPDTGDAAEDAYSYGFRLWEAKLYPEAQAKLKEFVGKYPKHKRVSYANNLLGRAYLDEGKPGLAANVFLDNYKGNPRGDRAPDSLLYLGQALTKLKSLDKACLVYDEFKDVYGATASNALKSLAEKGRTDAKCTA